LDFGKKKYNSKSNWDIPHTTWKSIMPRPSIGEYPPEWEILAYAIKQAARWRCVRCNHIHAPEHGRMLTVHHIDLNKSNCAWWNLVALCQKCHLQIQHKIVIERLWMFEHKEWFKPYAAGYYADTIGLSTLPDEIYEKRDEILDAVRQGYYIA
jgi:5-methylcytosine-specific restriction endonuclease McrA